MVADSSAWPATSAADERALRRILACCWGMALLAVLLLPSLGLLDAGVPATPGALAMPGAPAAPEAPAGFYQRLVMGVAGLAALVGGMTGLRRWGWVTLTAAPLLVGLGVWEYLDLGGAWWQIWWRPALGCSLVAVPAWLLAGRGLRPA